MSVRGVRLRSGDDNLEYLNITPSFVHGKLKFISRSWRMTLSCHAPVVVHLVVLPVSVLVTPRVPVHGKDETEREAEGGRAGERRTKTGRETGKKHDSLREGKKSIPTHRYSTVTIRHKHYWRMTSQTPPSKDCDLDNDPVSFHYPCAMFNHYPGRGGGVCVCS